MVKMMKMMEMVQMVRECGKQSSVWQIIYTKWHNLELIKSKQNTNRHIRPSFALAAIFAPISSNSCAPHFCTARHATTDSLAPHEYDVFAWNSQFVTFVSFSRLLNCLLRVHWGRVSGEARSPSVILSARVCVYLCVCVCVLCYICDTQNINHGMIWFNFSDSLTISREIKLCSE